MLVALMMPRFILFVMWVFSHYLNVFQTAMWPILGFVFMPFTTVGYAIVMNEFGSMTPGGIVLMIIAVMLDLGAHSSSTRSRE